MVCTEMRPRLCRIALALVLCLATSALGADKDLPWLETDLGKKLDDTVDQVGKGQFWGAVLVALKGEVLLAKGYGMADYAVRPNVL